MAVDSLNDPKYLLQSVDNTLSLLETMARHEPLFLADLVKLTHLGKSSLFRMLYTLEKRNFVARTEDGKYFLSYKLASIGAAIMKQMELPGMLHPYLERLAKSSGESCHLVVLAGDSHIQFIDKVTGTSSIAMQSTIGLTIPSHLTGTGKVLLAYADRAFVDAYIRQADFSAKTPYSIQSGEELLDVLAQIRLAGYGYDKEEHEIGLVCFAAPVRDFGGNVIAAVSVSGAKERMYFQKEQLIRWLLDTARTMSESLR